MFHKVTDSDGELGDNAKESSMVILMIKTTSLPMIIIMISLEVMILCGENQELRSQ